MKRALYITLLAAILSAAPALAAGPDAGCRRCHPDMAAPMPPAGQGHAIACTRCHLGQGQAATAQAGHAGLAANPAALDQAGRACGPCHPGWPQKVRRSPMATAVGLINQTRYLWGAQPDALPRYGVRAEGPLAALSAPAQSGRPVDDLLRRRCLRCHLWTAGADADGARRSAGCAACHRPRDAQGRRPQGHGLTKKIPVRQCLTCHAGCGVGAEYAGRTPRDALAGARFLDPDPERPALWQARSWRPMQPDLHYKAGLACLDCHPRSEVMGDNVIRPAGLLAVGLRCHTCHGRPGAPPHEAVTSLGVRLNNVSRQGAGLMLRGKLDGRLHRVPALTTGPKSSVAHQVPQHVKVACHACHAAYAPAAWGLQVQLETRTAYGLWQPIAAQGDPQVLELIERQMRLPPGQRSLPMTRDYLSGQARPGVWILSPFFRRQEWRVYGLGPDGRAYLLSPRFQYVVTLLDDKGRLVQGAAIPAPGLGLTPYNPHTTARATMGCAACHGAARALGLGLTFVQEGRDKNGGPRLAPGLWQPKAEGLNLAGDWTRVVDLSGRPQQALLVPGARPYNRSELLRLLKPGKEYTRWLLKALAQEWPPSTEAPRR
ncbi:MAG: hypothetical protein C4525_00525 [Desulfarculus sp.]|nr:MAG: hypothetical protein C4525_00525 [Desulfarculus sp.]